MPFRPLFLWVMVWPSTGIFLALLLLAAITALLLFRRVRTLNDRIRSEKMLTYFATSLYGQNTVDDIFWDIAKNCMSQLKFEDCVIYQYDEVRKILVQKAAFGPKNPGKHEILNPIEIPLGKGIVGSVAATGRPEIIPDTTRDPRYILDDQLRCSEITVPIFVDGKLFGILDSEHHRKHFFTVRHLMLLEQIASICAVKISKFQAEEKLRQQIARDLHDEMGSTLTSITILSKLALQQVPPVSETFNHLQKINGYAARMMESMSDIVWTINPLNDSLDRMIVRMKEHAAELLEPARINYTFDECGAFESIRLNLEQRKDLYLIYKEALNNAVKYSGATEVQVVLHHQDSLLKMEVKDNGRGFDGAKSFSGNGLKNMRNRAAGMHAAFAIQSSPGKGTTVGVELVAGNEE